MKARYLNEQIELVGPFFCDQKYDSFVSKRLDEFIQRYWDFSPNKWANMALGIKGATSYVN